MRFALVIRPQSKFHHVLGFIDALDLNDFVDCYVCNDHDFVGLLKQSYLSELEDRYRENVGVFSVNSFGVDKYKMYDVVVFASGPLIEDPKSYLLLDILPHPVTDKLVICESAKKRKPIAIRELVADELYLALPNAIDLDEELALVGLVGRTRDLQEQAISANAKIIQAKFPEQTEFSNVWNSQTIHLVAGSMFTNTRDLSKSVQQWGKLGHSTKVWQFDQVLELVETLYPHMMTNLRTDPNFPKKIVVFHESGMAADPNFVPLKHLGHWGIVGDTFIQHTFVGSVHAQDKNVLKDVFSESNSMTIWGYFDQSKNAKHHNPICVTNDSQYESWFIAAVCVLGVLVQCCMFQIMRSASSQVLTKRKHADISTNILPVDVI